MTRALLCGGARIPFVRSFAEYTELDTIALGVLAVRGALEKAGLRQEDVDAVIWGGVVLPPTAPNVGREIVLDLGMPARIEARTVTRACASGLQAITDAVAAVERGDADVIIAGGSDSTSNAALTMPESLIRKVGPVVMGKKAGMGAYLGLATRLSLTKDLLPRQPRVAERSTGQLMGEAAEDMARRHGITREAQDALAVRSHQRAFAAWESGRFDAEVVPVTLPDGRVISRDTVLRGDTTIEALAKLRPAFGKKGEGTLTAANSTPLTDGAAAVIVASEAAAARLGLTPLAAVRSWAYVGVDPADQLLIGPALAMPKALARAGLELGDIDRVDLHEAFAAVVLCVQKALASDAFARERLGRDRAVGVIDEARLNVHGGSVALGHPFGATGARLVLTMARELHLTGAKTALLGICAAGGLGAAAVLERV
jgi:acetyl-CoA acyltransferase